MPMPDHDDIAAIYQLLGFDPDSTQALILTPESAVAISTNYPEPADPPTTKEPTDADGI